MMHTNAITPTSIKGPRHKVVSALKRMYWGKLNIDSLGRNFAKELIDLYCKDVGIAEEDLYVVINAFGMETGQDGTTLIYEDEQEAQEAYELLLKSNIKADIKLRDDRVEIDYYQNTRAEDLVFGLDMIVYVIGRT